jgi:hypothetical protein
MHGTDASLHAALVDAHVHFHPCFDPELFLDSARDNFRAVAQELDLGPRYCAYLLLTETADAHWYALVKERASHGWKVSDLWTAQSTTDDRQLRLVHSDGTVLNVVAGRQIAAAENLEVLALGTAVQVPDGYPLIETLQRVMELDAMAVLPWGFGKWLGRRGHKVRNLIDTMRAGQIFLGDNSARLAGVRDPELFDVARAKGIAILPGTDPFPFPGHERRVGRMGLVVRAATELSEWRDLRAAIVAKDGLAPFGELEQPLPFVMNQVRMQLAKHASRRRAPAY